MSKKVFRSFPLRGHQAVLAAGPPIVDPPHNRALDLAQRAGRQQGLVLEPFQVLRRRGVYTETQSERPLRNPEICWLDTVRIQYT
jgi:hypothetical protein